MPKESTSPSPRRPIEVSIKTTVSFKSWMVPNFVTPVDGKSIPLKEADETVVDVLAEKWLEQMYANAGRRNPWQKRVFRG